MQLNSLKRDVAVSAGLAPSAFTIQASAQMFSVLADKLYSDKILAVVREYTCNAIDAHMLNGNTDPWYVAMPSNMEPMFVVRDFGPGMSDHDVMHRFTSFGDSSKNDDPNQIGGFGLGCKAGFAYSDAFTVTSYQGGEKRVYAAFRGGDGVPQMTSLSVEATTEKDGLEIRVPVREEDFYEFEETAHKVLQFFTPGSFTTFGMTVDPVTYSAINEHYNVLHHALDTRKVLMGPVAYDLVWSKVLKDGEKALPETILPVFKVGELDLQPSREGLSYDPRTVATLRARYELIASELANDLYTAVKKLTPFRQLEFIQNCKNQGTWSFVETAFGKDGFPGIKDYIPLKGRPEIHNVYVSSKNSASCRRHGTSAYGQPMKGDLELKFDDLNGGRVYFIIDDMKDAKTYHKRTVARFKHRAKSVVGQNLTVYFFDYIKTRVNKPPPFIGPLQIGKRAPNDREEPIYEDRLTGGYETKQQLIDALPGYRLAEDRVFFLSELELPLSEKKKAERGVAALRVLSYKIGESRHRYYRGRGKSSSYWSEYPEVVEGGIYMPMNNYETDITEDWLDSPFLPQDRMVWGLSKKAQMLVRNSANEDDFVRVDDYVRAAIQRAIDTDGVMDEIRRRSTLELLKNAESPRVRNVIALLSAKFSRKFFPQLEAILDPVLTGASAEIQGLAGNVIASKILGNVKLPVGDKKLVARISKVIEKTLETSALLRLALTVRDNQHTNILIQRGVDKSMDQLVHDLGALSKVKLKKEPT